MWQEIEELMQDLYKTLAEYKKYNKEYAINEYKYRTALSKRLVELRASGQPVTHLADIARGEVEVANAKEQEIIAESLYNSCKEAILTYKLQIKILQAQINNDYGNGSN